MGAKHPVQVFVDHANLLHYRHPQKVNRRIARYILTLADYDLEIHHRPGPLNRADALSRRPDYDDGKEDNQDVVPLPNSLFAEKLRSAALSELIQQSHKDNNEEFARLKTTHGWEKEGTSWKKDGRLVVLSNQLKRDILKEHHDHPIAGHPGAASTYFSVRQYYWWPRLKEHVQQYFKCCRTCQQNNANTHKRKPPLFPITPKEGAHPFETVSMDWITKLPPSSDFDSILTITDHDCSKVVLFIPCKEKMGTKELAETYFKKVFPHYGIPRKIISDRDPRITSQLAKDICTEIGIQQNISTAYHPQTDGQSERTNQTLETYLCIFCNEQQTDWAKWLPLAQFAINSRPSHTTKIPPFELLIGITPRSLEETPQKVLALQERKDHFNNIRKRAQEAILHAQMLLSKDTTFRPYKEGEQVWLDARNLRTTHPTHKLRPKRYGPFMITKVLSHVAYQLALPPTWKIHNVFHASYLSLFRETAEHGPNFLEPPPEIVEGEPEWEVEQIVGMRYYGPKRIKQYRIRWKGYAPAHDTWEPIENVHAPKLVQQFLNEQGRERDISIRAARVGTTKDDMYDPRESQYEIPGLQPTTNIPSRAVSVTSDPEYAKQLASEFSARVLRGTTQILQTRLGSPSHRAAHHEVLQETPSPEQEEAGAARTDPKPSPGPTKPTKDNQTHHPRSAGRVITE